MWIQIWSQCYAAETIGFFPKNAMRAPKRAKRNLPTVPAARRRNAKAGALEAAKNVVAAVAEVLHASVEARCRRLDAAPAKSTEFAPFR
jgi:hypothetical protein